LIRLYVHSRPPAGIAAHPRVFRSSPKAEFRRPAIIQQKVLARCSLFCPNSTFKISKAGFEEKPHRGLAMYVVVVEFDNEEKDYKVYEHRSDAVAHFELAHTHKRLGKISKLRSSEEVTVLDCKVFKPYTADAREAVRLVKEGKAERFYQPMTDRNKQLLDKFQTDTPVVDDKRD
jgi:hypothetical protein